MAVEAERLRRIWEAPYELALELDTVDHKKIGVRYITTAFGFFLLAGIMALIMRTQLALPEQDLVSAERFNQLFTMHGTLMIFFFATPILFGFGNYMVPLMIGARDMAFPRLNAFGYWVFLFAGLFLFSSFLIGGAPNGGWFAYVPLSGPAYSPDVYIDFWVVGLIFLGISTTAGAINFIVTIFKMRAPGMTISRIPLFVWSILATSFAIIFALPPLTAGNLLLLSDRVLGSQFFNPVEGGDPLLWQHLFWFFGHPDVYIIFLPAVGIVSTVIPVFSRRPITSYPLVVVATLTIAFIGFGVWVHHMFAVGLPQLSLAFFAAASMMIAIPSAVQIFAWIATIWDGRPQFTVPFMFALGFLVLFVMGGITGVMFAVIPFDLQATDSYFVVAHFHYVLFGGAVFPIFAGLYYWLPKMTGRLLNDRLGYLSFWLMFVGFNLAFFPQHIAGLAGMPRRIYTYGDGLGWTGYNLASTAGSFILGAAILVFMVDFLLSLRHGAEAGDDPWGGDSLEWSTTSPPPAYNFARVPQVTSRSPMWDESPAATAAEPDRPLRQAVTSTLHDAEARTWLPMPGETLTPLIIAFGMLLVAYGMLPDVGRAFPIAAGIGFVTFGVIRWFWGDSPAGPEQPTAAGQESVGWWGMAMVVLTEAVLFSTLLTAYLYTRAGFDQWPPDDIARPELLLPGIGTVLLLSSSLPMVWAEAGARRGENRQLRGGLLLSFLLAAAFLGVQAIEYSGAEFSISTNVYGSLFFFITGLHAAHVVIGLLINAFLQVKAWRGHFTPDHHLAVQNGAIYWHFVDVVWIGVLGVVYLSPHLIPS